MSRESERRQHKRYAVNMPFLVRFSDTARLRKVYVRDISKGGMFLRTSNPRGQGSKVSVVLELPDGTQFTLSGIVVYVAEGEKSGNGVQFTDLGKDTQWLLEEYIALHEEDAPAAPQEQRPAPQEKPAATQEEPARPKTSPHLQVIPPGALPEPEPPPEPRVDELEVEVEDEEESDGEIDSVLAQLEPMGEPGEPGEMHRPGPALRQLLQVEDDLVEIEERMRVTAYSVLGVDAATPDDEIETAYAEARARLGLEGSKGRVPVHVKRRLQRVVSQLDAAIAVLRDRSQRASLDARLNLLPPGIPSLERRKAFRAELARKQSEASEQQRADFVEAKAYVEAGIRKFNAGDLTAAQSLLRTALLLNPYDMDVRQRLSVVEAELSIRV